MHLKPLIIGFLGLLTLSTYAETTMFQTKAKLQQLEFKINKLEHALNTAHDKNKLLNHELSNTEKKISTGINQLRIIQQDINHKEHKITALKKEITSLNTQLEMQQKLLAKHVRARYSMGEYQPLKWLLNQDDPNQTSRLLTFYEYIVKSRQHLIMHVQSTKKELILNQAKLQQELKEQQQLQKQLSKSQQKLEQDKLYNMAILRGLTQDIHSQEQTLEEYQRNKNNLSHLLKSLAQQSTVYTPRPFIYKKLPKPVGTNYLKHLNQGMVFFAPEGSPVAAVSPGKVVFSDWLKGYGLLLIIDHGRGFMTLYAHNQSLFKQKGDSVSQGEQIATVGHSGGIKQNGLYFEIRQRGKAIPPLKWVS
jgi:septal ring factor EnvC (AmiA/AmiB activator)